MIMSPIEMEAATRLDPSARSSDTAQPVSDWRQPRWSEIPRCFSVRQVALADACTVGERRTIRPADVVLAEVLRLGQHRRLQLASGRYRALEVGDLFLAAAGCRYAVDQFEGRGEIRAGEPCALLAGGGVVGVLEARHTAMNPPTDVRIHGVVEDAAGRRLTLARYAKSATGERPHRVIAVVGSGMNAGKTTAAAALVRGLQRSGLRVGAIKATGTGSFGDLQAYEDAGANWVGDFGLTGMASTYRQPVDRLVASLEVLLALAGEAGCEAAVVELADGLLQPETEALLNDPRIRRSLDGLLYAACDPLSALGGLELLDRSGWRAIAVTGLVTRAPLAVRELQAVHRIDVWSREELSDPALANRLLVPMDLAENDH
jgi:hypothetical protein